MSETVPPPEENGSGQEQASQPQNPLLSALLGSMAGGGGVDPMSLLMSQLGNQGASDPRMALLTQLLSQRRAPEIDGVAEEIDLEQQEKEARRRMEIRRERARRIRELRVLAKKMYAELEVLRERNDTLAAALGACYVCFGTDPACPECRGRGVPGSADPDPDAYREYVLPAVSRAQWLQKERERRAQRYMSPRVAAAADAGVAGHTFGQSFETAEGRPLA